MSLRNGIDTGWPHCCSRLLQSSPTDIDSRGTLVSSVGSMGSQLLQFSQLQDAAVHHNGRLFATDGDNHYVQVLNSDLTYSYCFGSKGLCPGELNVPRGVTIDSDGMVYIADCDNNRVQKFTPEGEVLAVIDRKGEGGSQLNAP